VGGSTSPGVSGYGGSPERARPHVTKHVGFGEAEAKLILYDNSKVTLDCRTARQNAFAEAALLYCIIWSIKVTSSRHLISILDVPSKQDPISLVELLHVKRTSYREGDHAKMLYRHGMPSQTIYARKPLRSQWMRSSAQKDFISL
jgi:hypothetical protein